MIQISSYQYELVIRGHCISLFPKWKYNQNFLIMCDCSFPWSSSPANLPKKKLQQLHGAQAIRNCSSGKKEKVKEIGAEMNHHIWAHIIA